MVTKHLQHFSAIIKYPYKYSRKARNRKRKIEQRNNIQILALYMEDRALLVIHVRIAGNDIGRLVDEKRRNASKIELIKEQMQNKLLSTKSSVGEKSLRVYKSGCRIPQYENNIWSTFVKDALRNS